MSEPSNEVKVAPAVAERNTLAARTERLEETLRRVRSSLLSKGEWGWRAEALEDIQAALTPEEPT